MQDRFSDAHMPELDQIHISVSSSTAQFDINDWETGSWFCKQLALCLNQQLNGDKQLQTYILTSFQTPFLDRKQTAASIMAS